MTSGVNRFYNLIQIAFPLTDSSLVGFFGYYLTEQMGEVEVHGDDGCGVLQGVRPQATSANWAVAVGGPK